MAIPSTLNAGTHNLRVIRSVAFYSSTTPHTGFASNPVPFQVVPIIHPPAAPPPPPAAPYQAKLGQPFTLTLTPAVGVMQQVVVYIGDNAIPMPPMPLSGPPTSATVTVTVPATLTAENYPLRVEVDGAQSRLTLDTTSGSPSLGQYLPQVGVSA